MGVMPGQPATSARGALLMTETVARGQRIEKRSSAACSMATSPAFSA
jgi:hypothetical protein